MKVLKTNSHIYEVRPDKFWGISLYGADGRRCPYAQKVIHNLGGKEKVMGIAVETGKTVAELEAEREAEKAAKFSKKWDEVAAAYNEMIVDAKFKPVEPTIENIRTFLYYYNINESFDDSEFPVFEGHTYVAHREQYGGVNCSSIEFFAPITYMGKPATRLAVGPNVKRYLPNYHKIG